MSVHLQSSDVSTSGHFCTQVRRCHRAVPRPSNRPSVSHRDLARRRQRRPRSSAPDRLQRRRQTASVEAPPPTFSLPRSAASFTVFTLLTVNDIVNAVRQLPDKFSAADPLPTSTLKQAINLLAPFIVEIFNRSLARGLYWLRAKDRVRFKTAVLMYKATRGTTPSYLSQLFRVAEMLGRCSARTNRLLVPSVKLSTVGRRAFPIAGPAIWNSLPDNVISAPSLSSFRQRLKHFCSRPRSPTLSLIPGKLSPLQ